VVGGVTYYYVVQAVDTSFNRSGYSNQVSGVPQQKMVEVTFNIGVPEHTPGTVFIVGDIAAFGPWNPGLVPMTQVSPTLWTYTAELPDGLSLQYKFTRGTWETVEWWGSITGFTNRQVTIDYGADGTQLIDLTATDWGSGPDDTKAVQFWRDPYVIDFAPADLATGVPNDTTIWATWSKTMTLTTTFELEGAAGLVTGTFGYDEAAWTTVFTPSALLADGVYTVTVTGQAAADGEAQQLPAIWQFQAGPLPTVQLADAAYSVDEAAGVVVITVTLNGASIAPVTVTYATADGTALAGEDYVALSGTLTFAPGETQRGAHHHPAG
jgi:alpha-glucosidase